jgi:hypothetical protein
MNRILVCVEHTEKKESPGFGFSAWRRPQDSGAKDSSRRQKNCVSEPVKPNDPVTEMGEPEMGDWVYTVQQRGTKNGTPGQNFI